MNPEEARLAALRSFGPAEPMKEEYRDQRSFPMIEATLQDVRFAFRFLRRNPGFAATAVAVLSLAIGANSAMFSVLNAVLFRPLPYASPEQLTMLWSEVPSQGAREGRTAYQNIEQWRRHSFSFADIAFFDPVSATLIGSAVEEAQQVSVTRVSPNFFGLLGVKPVLGRFFTLEEANERQRLALVSERFWHRRLGGSPGVIGATIDLDGRPSRIIGVIPAAVRYPGGDSDVWEPHTMFPDWEALRSRSGVGSWFAIGRLRPDVTFERAQAEMSAIARSLSQQTAAAPAQDISLVPLSDQVTGPRARLALWLLAGAVFCVLLVAATNVASLSLARNAAREKEIALRAALGASRGRIARQLLAESLVLSLVSAVVGLLVAFISIRLIQAIGPGDVARLSELRFDFEVLVWAFAFCLLTGVFVGLAPAWTGGRQDLRSSIQQGGRSDAGGAGTRGARRVLVVMEFAISIVLLAGAGLLIRSLWSVERVNPGFRQEGVLSAQISSPAFLSNGQRIGFYNRVLERMASLPGVQSAGMIGDLFFGGNPEQVITTEGKPGPERVRFRRDEVSEGLFRTLGTPLLKGRNFSATDTAEAPPVAIINEAMARRLWPGLDPIGRRFRLGSPDSNRPWFTVVGIAGDMRRQSLEMEPLPQMFEPLAQNPSRLMTVLVRTSAEDPLRMARAVQSAVQTVDKNVPVYAVTTLEDCLDTQIRPRRLQTSLLIGFAGLALLMAVIGIYGLMQYTVSMRTREIGIRLALGAPAGGILRMVISEGLKLSLAGVAVGLVGAWWLGRVVAGLLFRVAPADPVTFAVVPAFLIAVAALACLVPARRATKIDALEALR
jgi:putative ABC transport system permease protein